MEKSNTVMEAKHHEIELSVCEDSTVAPTTEFQLHDLRSINFNRVSWLIFTAIVGAAFSIGGVINFLANDKIGWMNWAIWGVGLSIVSMLIILAFRWPRLVYERAGWRLDEVGLQIRRGVIWRQQISVPVARVQHADVSQGPLQRHFGLGKLTIHTAGTQNASVVIEGLAHETALQLRDKLVAQRKSGHVV